MRQLFLLVFALPLCAQDANLTDPKFSSDVNVVSVLATVRDSSGHIAKDLTRDDFVLLEDGVPQTIRYFSRESDLPLLIGLLVDTSRSQIKVMEPERSASYTFLDQVLRPDKDQAFVANFDTRVALVQDFTSSREDLRAGLDRLQIPSQVATLLYEAIRETSEYMMRPRQGRKAFILLSDGASFRDKTDIGTAIEFAQRADTIIYSILYSGVNKAFTKATIPLNPTPFIYFARGKSAMERLARETGGACFEISKSNTIEDAYAQIEDALRNHYSLGYTPSRAGDSGQYRKITLKVNKPGLIVQTRAGYYAK
jgi:VWFA-related protein